MNDGSVSDELLRSLHEEWRQVQVASKSPVPLYYRLFSVLQRAILDGQIAYGERMPSEQQLIELFAVSRITAKRAMDELAGEGLITRSRGRGSYVVHRYEPRALKAPLIGMMQSFSDLAIHSKSQVQLIGEFVPPPAVRSKLHMGAEDTAMKIVRVHSNEQGVPYSHYVSWTFGASPKVFTKRNLESMSRLKLLSDSGIELVRSEQLLSAVSATDEIAGHLRVAIGTALLSLERRSFDNLGRCLDLVHGLYNPSLFKYRIELSRDS